MKPEAPLRTWNVWPTELIVPDRNDNKVLADARSAALMPPGN